MEQPPPQPAAGKPRGRNIPYSLPRRWVGDMLHAARQVPVVAAERVLDLKPLRDARRNCPRPPSWSSLIIKALGIVSMRIPETRQAYLGFPWGRIHEAPYSVASIIFTREFQGETATFFSPMVQPELLSVDRIGEKVQAWKTDPIAAHGTLRRLVRNAKPPRLIRKFLWWFGLNWFGMLRARYFGTFAISTVGALGGRVLQFQTPLTQVIYYGTLDRDGGMPVQWAFDHRVYDGIIVAKSANELESVLNREMVEEVRALAAARRTSPAESGPARIRDE